MVMWVVFTALGCGMTMFYAAKIKKAQQSQSHMRFDAYFREQNEKQVLTKDIPLVLDTF